MAALWFVFRSGGWKGIGRLLSTLTPRTESVRWYVIAAAVPAAIGSVSIGSFQWFGSGSVTLRSYTAILSVFGIDLLLSPIEEVGWRGFALPRLQTRRTALGASVILGLVWGIWHTPLYALWWLAGQGFWGFAQGQLFFYAETVLLSILLTWLFNSSRGSLLTVCVFHAALNTVVKAVVSLEPSDSPWPFLVGLALAIGLVAILLLTHGPGSLASRDKVTVVSE